MGIERLRFLRVPADGLEDFVKILRARAGFPNGHDSASVLQPGTEAADERVELREGVCGKVAPWASQGRASPTLRRVGSRIERAQVRSILLCVCKIDFWQSDMKFKPKKSLAQAPTTPTVKSKKVASSHLPLYWTTDRKAMVVISLKPLKTCKISKPWPPEEK